MIRPLILAAGEGKRMELRGMPKPLVSVDGLVPLIGNAAARYLSLGYRESQVTVMVGHMADRITSYLGDDFDYHNQEIIGDPTDGLISWLSEAKKKDQGLPDKVSVLNCDDAAWVQPNDMQRLMRDCDTHKVEGIMLSSVYELGQHKFGFINNNSRIIQTCEGFSRGAGYVAGFFVVDAAKFLDYIEYGEGERKNIVTYFSSRDLTSEETIAVINHSPRVCVNTRDALFRARSIYAQYYDK